MSLISDKVTRTINEKVDSSVYAIKASVNFTNTMIYNNDMFLSASTESYVSLINTSISNLTANGMIIQAVSSSLLFSRVNITNISYNYPSSGQNFYKISVVNQSIL